MTLRQAIDLAMQQSPDLMLARLDQDKARLQAVIAHDPFVPKVFAGSGAAYTTGFPANIEGQAPSILEAKTQMAIFDRPQSFQVAQAKETARGAEIDIAKQQAEITFRVASLFLDAAQAARSLEAVQNEIANLQRVRDLVEARVEEGRDLSIAEKRAGLDVRRAQNLVDSLSLDLMNAETSLAMVLGMGPGDRVRAAREESLALTVPASEEETIEQAVESSPDIKRMESDIQAKTLQIRGYRAERLPKVNLIAQYEMFAKYYYQDYFTTFRRNSAQFGASIDVPLLIGRSARAYMTQAEDDIAKLRIQVNRTRAQITADLRRAFQDVKRAEDQREYAREDLDLAREQLSIDLAQNDEGRLPMAAVEQARAVEQEKWLAYYDAQHTAERARLNLLHQSGTLMAALK
ncbi:MAG TPA: TolC family protein [Bryobacteraceae bacterium]|nr:TolC family protein [Bryobacteraceae bacterium]